MPGASISNRSAKPGAFCPNSAPKAAGSKSARIITESGGNVTVISRVSPGPGTKLTSGVASTAGTTAPTAGAAGVDHSSAEAKPGTLRYSTARGAAPSDCTWLLPPAPLLTTTRLTFMVVPFGSGLDDEVAEAAVALSNA